MSQKDVLKRTHQGTVSPSASGQYSPRASATDAEISDQMLDAENFRRNSCTAGSSGCDDEDNSVYDTHSVESTGIPEELHGLPAPARWAALHIFLPLFPDDEPFPSFIRKVAVLTLSVMASAGWMLCLYFGIMAGTQTGGWTPLRINMFGMGFYMMVWYVGINYTYIRKTQSCPPWIADVASVGAFLGMFSFTIMTLEADTRVLLMSTLLLTAMMNTPRFPLLALGHAAVYVFHYLRTNFREEIPSLRFGFDAPPNTLSEKCIVFFVLSIVPSVGAILGMYVIISRYIKRSEEARVTEKMVFEVAMQLERYDTDGMEETLEQYGSEIDAALLGAFRNIKENLKSFKPHIPQYLIQAAVDRAEANDAEVRRTDLAAFIGEQDALSDEEFDEGDIDIQSQTMSMSSATSKTSHASSIHSRSSRRQMMSSMSLKQGNTAKPYTGLITTLYLDLNLKSSAVDLGVSSATSALEALNGVGKGTHASLHYVDGDSLFVSWNATSRVAGHEVKGCQFATRALEALKPFACYSPSISIATSHCTSMFAGTTQAHFVVFPEDPERHQRQRALAKALSTTVASSACRRGAECQFTLMGFELERVEGKPPRIVYELVQAKTAAAENEWMYQLEAQSGENDPYSSVTGALQTYVEKGNMSRGEIEKELSLIAAEVKERETFQHLISKVF